MSAAHQGCSDTAELLISKGADINAKDDYNWTALMYAASKGYKDICELLKSHGAKEK